MENEKTEVVVPLEMDGDALGAYAQQLTALSHAVAAAGMVVVGTEWVDKAKDAIAAVAKLRAWIEHQMELHKTDPVDEGEVPLVNSSVVLQFLDNVERQPPINLAAPAEQVAFEVEADRIGMHLIKLTEDGWRLRHPQACKDSPVGLFGCAVDSGVGGFKSSDRGVFRCWVDEDGAFVLGDKVAGL